MDYQDNSVITQDDLLEAKISVKQALNDKSSDLYVINTSDMNGTMQQGEINCKFTLENQNNRNVQIKIPTTWIPINLTNYLKKEIWLNDYTFCELVNKRVVTLISNNVAESLLERDEVKIETKRLEERENSYGGMLDMDELNERHNQNIVNQQKISNANKLGSNTPKKSETTAAVSNVNIKVYGILNNKNIDELTKINSLTSIQKELNKTDLDFIMAQSSRNELRLKEWVLKAKKRLQA